MFPRPLLSCPGLLVFGVHANELFAALGDALNLGLHSTIVATPPLHFINHIHRYVDRMGLSLNLCGQEMSRMLLSVLPRTPAVRIAASAMDLRQRSDDEGLLFTHSGQLAAKSSFHGCRGGRCIHNEM